MSSEKSAPEWPWPPASDHQATYDLHCHCGTIRYTMTVSPPLYAEHTQGTEQQYTAVECTCSWCQRNGEIMAHPLTKNVSFDHGAENRSEYRFGSRIAPHWVCKTCGSTLGADLGPMLKKMGMEERLAINVSFFCSLFSSLPLTPRFP